MRQRDMNATMGYTHQQVTDLAQGIEKLPDLDIASETPVAELMRNGGCAPAREGATDGGLASPEEGDPSGCNDITKGLSRTGLNSTSQRAARPFELIVRQREMV